MKICVQLEDGRTEVLELRGGWVVIEGKYLSRIRDSQGFEHFFTPDGYYDGWGANVPQTDESFADALLQALEEKRNGKEQA